jgi:ABC-type glycerol-3-phosphate transport system substrate-binding protein
LTRPAARAVASLAPLVMVLGLAACGGLVNPPAGASQQVDIGGLAYRVEQITASTWTATPPAGRPAARSASLVQAIEKASGCTVTDSSFGQQGAVLNAQVDCGSRLKN